MAETISTAAAVGNKEMALKENSNSIIVDMSPTAAAAAALLQHHNPLITHAHTLRSCFKENNSSQEEPVAGIVQTDMLATAAGSGSSSISPTNLSTPPPPPLTTFRCERCDNFETSSRASLLLHVVQCLSSPARLKTEEPDLENHNGVTTVSHHEQSSVSAVSKLSTVEQQQQQQPNLSGGIVVNGSASSPAASSSSSSSSRKVFECDVCNMKFSNGANMRRHKMRHTGVKPYECRVCQKRFFRKDHLAEHFTTHTKTLPYHCPICNRGFQRQIAMRAHFQNEHVGQHDLVKTCPLCSYRAGSMKSLRIHFFNRHGIDLDNPGPGGTSSLLLALESQASQVAAAAAAAGFVPGLSAATAAVAAAAAANASSASLPSHQSDSGESLRSMENATPPMHFLTPQVEISTLSDNGSEPYNVTQDSDENSSPGQNAAFLCVLRAFALQGNSAAATTAIGGEPIESKVIKDHYHQSSIKSPAAPPQPQPPQDHPMDCNAKSLLPSSTSSSVCGGGAQLTVSPKSHHHENHITPSISLIPIKQEPLTEDLSSDFRKCGQKLGIAGSEQIKGGGGSDCIESEYSSSNTGLTSLIKVSPLKSLLREDLKRRICAKANNRITRNAAALENNNIVQGTTGATGSTPNSSTTTTCNSTPICNGTITSSGQETETTPLNRKQILTCLFCGIEFPDETLYFLHKGCHCESNPWKCNICGEQCNNVYEFNSHLLSKSHQ